MKIFVTGATGFAGSHLIDLLLGEEHRIYALVHGGSSHQPLPDNDHLFSISGDLLNGETLESIIAEIEPDLILHLAGQASPRQSWLNPSTTIAINTGGTANILKAAVNAGGVRTVVITSAEIYGRTALNTLPITENTQPTPKHPYGVSKWAAALLVDLYWRKYKLPVIEARPLNHIGPRQTPGFVVPDFASQVAKIRAGKQAPMVSVGNLDVERDFTDVRDVVRAYWALALEGRSGETYLICSGHSVSIRFLLETLIGLAGIDVEIEQVTNLVRPSDTMKIVGSFAKLHRDTGWQPSIDIRQSLNDSLLEWEQKWAD